MLAKRPGAPAWMGAATALAIGGAAFLLRMGCRSGNSQTTQDAVPFCLHVHSNKPVYLHEQLVYDVREMVGRNHIFGLLACYALHPLLVAHLWPNAWRPAPPLRRRAPPADPLGFARLLASLLREPAIYRPLLSVSYLNVFWHAMASGLMNAAFFTTAWSAPLTSALLLGVFASLMHLLPSREVRVCSGACVTVNPSADRPECARVAHVTHVRTRGRPC